MEDLCHCGSGLLFDECCKPFINGHRFPLKPVQLMRSRYTAYVLHNLDYLISTWHPDCRAEQWRDDIAANFPLTEWKGLTIKDERAGKNGHESYVEFIALFYDRHNRRPGFIHERSRFVQLNERWYYIDGIHQQPLRNAPCPCGSGKKYKKCCGQ
ncbi:YchJ family protein [Sodalis ligni]|uniref:YchJ family protein n=1 Tax=Sodalis ligni TaxID=2697027 RepID=UPI00193F8221|nr:YchJ family protein [Sodalis ligni]QWA08958.1 YchJ family protein [Sodalis ligni]